MTPLERELDAAAQSHARWQTAELLMPVGDDDAKASERARTVGWAAGWLFGVRDRLADRADRRSR